MNNICVQNPNQSVPTLSEWALILFGATLLLAGARYLAQKRSLKISV
jgi:hypothetical protein